MCCAKNGFAVAATARNHARSGAGALSTGKAGFEVTLLTRSGKPTPPRVGGQKAMIWAAITADAISSPMRRKRRWPEQSRDIWTKSPARPVWHHVCTEILPVRNYNHEEAIRDYPAGKTRKAIAGLGGWGLLAKGVNPQARHVNR